jgi:Protein of unknown function (DUF3800)
MLRSIRKAALLGGLFLFERLAFCLGLPSEPTHNFIGAGFFVGTKFARFLDKQAALVDRLVRSLACCHTNAFRLCRFLFMRLCFVDESGTPAKPDADRPQFFVIGAVIIPEERWHGVAGKLQGLKARLHYRGELKWRFFAPANKDAQNPMRDWTQEAKNEFRTEVFSILTSDRSIMIIAGVCQAAVAYALSNVNQQNDIYFRTYKVVTERFQYFLQDVTRTSGRNTYGIIVADHRGRGDDQKLRLQHKRLVEEDHAFTSTYTNLVEGLFLAPSHMSVGIQMADMVGGAIWRRFEHDDATWFDVIRPSIRQSRFGQVDGYGIARFPKAGWSGPVP